MGGISKMSSMILLLALTAVLLSLLFPPFYCFFLAPFALVPFCVCVLRRPMRKRFLLAYYLLGVAFFLPNLLWISPVTFGGFIALALFLAIYFPLFAVGIHRLVIHFRLPATVAVPLVWVGIEYLRSSFPLGGFPWFLLGNSFAPASVLIQGADIFGVWGISFFIAMLNGYVVDVLRLPLRQAVAKGARPGGAAMRLSPLIGSLTAAVSICVATILAYGVFRLNQQTTHPGPRIAVIQENIPQSLKEQGTPDIFKRHYELTQEAAAVSPKPDLIVWPETMLPGFGNIEFLTAPNKAFDSFETDEKLKGYWQYVRDLTNHYLAELGVITDSTEVPILLGVGSLVPRTNLADSPKQNRTVLLAPHIGPVDYYSKVHLVPFGEFVPFRGVPVLGKLMLQFSPDPGVDYSLIPGTRWTRFALPVSAYGDTPLGPNPPTFSNATYTFGTPICFEDTMPEPCRRMSAPQYADGRKADFLVNVSNDGWFHWVELDQHLQACQLRAVENRISMARSVNTGNSGFIDSNGRVVKLVTDGAGNSIGAVGFATWQMPIDSRVTIFSRIGDLFPIICGVLATLLLGWTFVRPRRGIRKANDRVP
jgi:apolipoprotein N-acyltransferase